MAEFHAWAAAGTVANLRSWMEAFANSSEQPITPKRGVVVAERVVEHLEFTLQQADGPDMEVSLSNAGLPLENGQKVAVVWAAPEDKPQGNTHCVAIVNQSTGAVALLSHNLPRLRGEPGLQSALGFGLLSTVPALFAALAWQLAPQAALPLDQGTLIMMTAIGAVLLFGLGALISRWMMEMRAQDDDRKIWAAASEALEAAGAGRHDLATAR
jgi:hypothetical protein